MFQVVRTRKVRAVEERFYGRTARIFYVGTVRADSPRIPRNFLSVGAADSAAAQDAPANPTFPEAPDASFPDAV